LTLDYGAAKMFLDVLNPNLIPEPGTAIGEAIRTAQQAFVQKERKYKVLILITDGEDHDTDPIGAAKEAAREGIRIYTIGIGSLDGEPIPLRGPNGQLLGYKKDESGQVVVSRLDETTLQKIALETNGKYYHGTAGGLELDRIYDEISQMEKKGLKGEYQTQYEDRYQYPLFLGLLLVLVEFILPERRKIQPETSESVQRVRISQ
jgi:Ca-activated chloride channel family protein